MIRIYDINAMMIDFLRRVFHPRVEPMNIIRIHKKDIIHNLHYLQSLQSHASLFPVLKSNAYGHGLMHMAKILDKTDVPYVIVDSRPEYMIVKKYTSKQILILGETFTENYRHFDLSRTTFCVYNIQTLKELIRMKKQVSIHIFLDTGMHREGLNEHNLKEFLDVLEGQKHIHVEGVMSHLHSADMYGDRTIVQQIALFKKMYYQIIDRGHTPIYRHIGNSAGLFKITDDFFNAYRPGLALYGYNPLHKHDGDIFLRGKKLRPAMDIYTVIVAKQHISKDTGVSYQHTRQPSKNTTIVSVPFGYMEGLPRIASNKLSFVHDKKTIAQVGTICMNLSLADIGDAHSNIGDPIQIVSKKISASNNIYAIAAAAQTIPYEILVKFDKGMRREVV